MSLIVASLALALSDVGPLDAFRANYAAIKVDTEYEFVNGTMSPEDAARIWESGGAGLREHPNKKLYGRWSCDGEAEYFQFGSPDEVIAAAEASSEQDPESKPLNSTGMAIKKSLGYIPKTEALFDGVLLAGHQKNDWALDGGTVINVWTDGGPGYVSLGKSPFLYWGTYPFPQIVQANFPGVKPERFKQARRGRPLDVEVYKKMQSEVDWLQIEIAYDPSIGYLPRYVRRVNFSNTIKSYISEMHLTDSKPCGSGGFVPTEWYSIRFGVSNFGSLYPNYNAETVVKPTKDVTVGRFKVTRFKDRMAPVALTDLTEIHTIASAGGRVSIGPGIHSLTLDAIKSKMGRKLVDPAPNPLPSLDVAEIQQFAPAPSRWSASLFFPILAACFCIGFVGFFWRRKRLRVIVILVGFLTLPSCRPVSKPVFHMSATFSPSTTLYDWQAPAIPVVLNILNDGTESIRILGVDGGCACRQVDQSPLPANVRPGRIASFNVKVSTNKLSAPRSLPFNVETEQGKSVVGAVLHAMPEHQLSPETASRTALREDDEWSFDLVYRSIRKSHMPRPITTLNASPKFSVIKTGSKMAEVGLAPDYVYEDVTYRVKLNDRSLGLQKEPFTIIDPARNVLTQAFAVWQRAPFLSTTPERVLLGQRPIRVFLRCSDDTVELLRVRSSPDGVKAVVSSAREVVVSLGTSASNNLDGFVEVETTAFERPPLRFRVTRYVSSALDSVSPGPS